MSLTGALFLLAPRELARLYSNDPGIVGMAALLIPVAGVFQIFDGLQVVASGVLRGVGDTRAPMVVNILGFWLIGMPVSLLFGFGLGRGPVGLWWGLVAGLGAVALFLLARIRWRFAGELRPTRVDEAASNDAAPNEAASNEPTASDGTRREGGDAE